MAESDADLLAALDDARPASAPAADERLATLADVGRVVNSLRHIDEILDLIMDRLILLVRAERGFIMLVDADSGALTFRAARHLDRAAVEQPEFEISRGVVREVYEIGRPVFSVNAAQDPRFTGMPSLRAFGVRAILCVPLRIKERVIGVIYLDNRLRLGAFAARDLDFVVAFSDQAALALDNANLSEEKRRIRDLFEGYVSSEVLGEILGRNGSALSLAGQRRSATVMFCDLRGFTALAEALDPIEVVARLNEFYAEMGEIIFRHGGVLFTYMGDALMAVFGVPHSRGDDALRAVQSATAMSRRLDEMRSAWRLQGRADLEMGIGLNSGEVVAGDVGFARKREYTVIGDTVNVAARMEKLNKTFGSRIVLSDATRRAVEGALPTRLLGQVELRGKSRPAQVWTVEGFGPEAAGG